MEANDVVSLDLIKKKLGISGDSQNDILTSFRASAIGKIHQMTRRNILDKDNVTILSPDNPSGMQFITFYVYDAKPITGNTTVKYRTMQNEPGFDRDGTLTIADKFVDVNEDRVCVYNGDTSGIQSWPERDVNVPYQITLDVGMATADLPSEFITAALLLTSELYYASLNDTFAPNSQNALDVILKDYIKPNLSLSDEIEITAGIR